MLELWLRETEWGRRMIRWLTTYRFNPQSDITVQELAQVVQAIMMATSGTERPCIEMDISAEKLFKEILGDAIKHWNVIGKHEL